MNVDVRAIGFSLTDALRDHVQSNLRRAFAHRGTELRRVEVRLRDVNGPRGGDDMRCEVRARFAGGEVLRVARTDANLYAAVVAVMDVASLRSEERARRVRGERRRAA
jgi:ribosome-associated translation inhibitor RaiA